MKNEKNSRKCKVGKNGAHYSSRIEQLPKERASENAIMEHDGSVDYSEKRNSENEGKSCFGGVIRKRRCPHEQSAAGLHAARASAPRAGGL